ncbi:hypothetical protein AtubIFM55763_004367 [Aspergillus tubingensis]|uniref:oxidoreductase family, NAD-binding Rossmann fold protein n=1 Tax=Aspergillus tubingensis TaxID=5068 RepID=UPI0015792317|nr:oxidoreductase family, NAD-binding Rossmann fold protein [Aspergillus tubingensis]GFN17195.1 oxidoreductase family, NAD-binding Rossmann fold protein [Aspergillus tubingensis]GLA57920.1 hypothetical protein AtubIFM54640_005718 [Aspergillus tubingensis]GLA73449.1 hypothetical protein AtubIFM55763_004367 [Aspergillus tubingensis]GLA91691.1 hypothetical protein AtubIFM57143_005200 [Aspergillus tubingensis]GLB17727.1 hypothetical protein AtubIFM61612_007610 [Aspergillus tubingensis]
MEPRPNTSLYAKIFREPPIQVIVGSAKSSYFVHPDALSWCKNSALSAQIEGPWRQHGDESPIDWSDFDEQTVECVLSYLYTQDYYVPQLEVPPDDSCKDDDDGKAPSGIEPSTPESVPDDHETLNRPLTPLSRCLKAGLPADNNHTAAGACTYRASPNPDDRLGAEILIHAKVYCFAHRYCIRELEDFALQRLTKVLIIIDAETEAVFPYLADAIRVVYDSTPGANLQDNPARKLLSQYVALNYTKLESESFDQIMAEGGEFMVDLSHKLARRLNMSGIGAETLVEQIDDLQLQINQLSLDLHEQVTQLNSARKELMEWDSWNRGISGKYKKAKRKV